MFRTGVTAAVRLSATPATSSVRIVSLRVSQRLYSSGSTINDNDPDTIESEKQKNLQNKQHGTSTPHKHAPGWNEHLASTSEAYTKADKSDMSISDMQTNTVDYVRKRHPKTATETVISKVSDAVESAKDAAIDAKDTIMGPLASAAGKETSDSDSDGDVAGNSPKGKKQK